MTKDRPVTEACDIDRFIRETNFSGYQQIILPSGQVIPGIDRSPAADLVYGPDLTGKSVLDVGCYYGFFLHEAIRRGAKRAVGIESDPERFRIASTLAMLWGGKIDVREGLLEDVELNEQFDVVLLLNVLHHVNEPVRIIRQLASLCRGTLIVEFRQLHDRQFVECLHSQSLAKAGRRSFLPRLSHRLRTAVETRLMELLTKRLPVVGVGCVEYHRSYFFSQGGFKNMFQVHNRLFKHVEFRSSLTRGQALAICDCSERGQAVR